MGDNFNAFARSWMEFFLVCFGAFMVAIVYGKINGRRRPNLVKIDGIVFINK
jgi:hypothetical protein